MGPVCWIVDDYILSSRGIYDSRMIEAIKKSGANLHLTRYVPFAEQQDYGPAEWTKQPTVLYGTVGFVQKCNRQYVPGAFGLTSNMDCNAYYANVPSQWLLNSDYMMAPWGDIVSRPYYWLGRWPNAEMFIRPNSGKKVFTGQVFNAGNIDFEINSSQQLSSVMPETMCLMAPVRKLLGEFRFIVVNGQVVDGTEYRWDNVLDARHDWPQECWDMAELMATHSWQPDNVYTVDVALTGDGPRIIELNSFSCAGLYECDRDKVVAAINQAAREEWE